MPEESMQEKQERGMRMIDEALVTMDPTPVVERIMTILQEHDIGTFTMQNDDGMLMISVDRNVINAMNAFVEDEELAGEEVDVE